MKQDDAISPMRRLLLLSPYGDGEWATNFDLLVLTPGRRNGFQDIEDDISWRLLVKPVSFAALSRSKSDTRVLRKKQATWEL